VIAFYFARRMTFALLQRDRRGGSVQHGVYKDAEVIRIKARGRAVLWACIPPRISARRGASSAASSPRRPRQLGWYSRHT